MLKKRIREGSVEERVDKSFVVLEMLKERRTLKLLKVYIRKVYRKSQNTQKCNWHLCIHFQKHFHTYLRNSQKESVVDVS